MRRVSIRDVTFLHVGGQRETACGPEYQFVGKMCLLAGASVPSDLLRDSTVFKVLGLPESDPFAEWRRIFQRPDAVL
jgi:hypothetical protein